MQYKCKFCLDTGSMDQGDQLDCSRCDAADDRVALNSFVRSLGVNLTLDERTWAIHQRALAMAPKQEAPDGWVVVPVKPTPKMVDSTFNHDISKLSHNSRNKHIWAAMIVAAPEAPVAAPAAANGAMPELPNFFALGKTRINGIEHGHYSAEQMIAYGQACALAAAGPNAALVDAKPLVDITTAIMSQHGLIDHLSEVKTQAFCDDLRAALSGAKGN